MINRIILIIFISLFINIIESIPQDQKDKCQRVAKDSDDCLVELGSSYFCCFLKAKTIEKGVEVSLCGVIKASDINKKVK